MNLISRDALATIEGAAILDENDLKHIEAILLKEIKISIRFLNYYDECKHRINTHRPMSEKEPTATWRRERGMAMSDEELTGE